MGVCVVDVDIAPSRYVKGQSATGCAGGAGTVFRRYRCHCCKEGRGEGSYEAGVGGWTG